MAILRAVVSTNFIIVSVSVEVLVAEPVGSAIAGTFYDTGNELHADLAKILI